MLWNPSQKKPHCLFFYKGQTTFFIFVFSSRKSYEQQFTRKLYKFKDCSELVIKKTFAQFDELVILMNCLTHNVFQLRQGK